MSDQLPSDSLLVRLRKRVEIARTVESNVSLHPEQVMALVEIAEAANRFKTARIGEMSLALQALDAAVSKLEAL